MLCESSYAHAFEKFTVHGLALSRLSMPKSMRKKQAPTRLTSRPSRYTHFWSSIHLLEALMMAANRIYSEKRKVKWPDPVALWAYRLRVKMTEKVEAADEKNSSEKANRATKFVFPIDFRSDRAIKVVIQAMKVLVGKVKDRKFKRNIFRLRFLGTNFMQIPPPVLVFCRSQLFSFDSPRLPQPFQQIMLCQYWKSLLAGHRGMCSEHLESFWVSADVSERGKVSMMRHKKTQRIFFGRGKECLGKLITHLLRSEAMAASKPRSALKVCLPSSQTTR